MGYGGVGKAISAFFNFSTKSKVMISNRSKISKKILIKNDLKFVQWKKISSVLPNVDIIINCTTLGFDKNIKSPIRKKRIQSYKNNSFFFDAIYNPLETTFLKLSKLKSKNSLNGLEMNKMQAILAIKKVLNNKFSLESIKIKLKKF